MTDPLSPLDIQIEVVNNGMEVTYKIMQTYSHVLIEVYIDGQNSTSHKAKENFYLPNITLGLTYKFTLFTVDNHGHKSLPCYDEKFGNHKSNYLV